MSIRNYPETPRIYVDMDGVVADFERAFLECNLTAKEYKLIPGSYEKLLPIPGAIEGIRELLELGFFVMMLTKIPSQNPYAASEKLIWIKKHLPELHDYVIITPDKGAVGTFSDHLIDDHPEWANAHNFPGMVIKFNGEPDEDHSHMHCQNWTEVVEHFKTHRNIIFEIYKAEKEYGC